MICRRFFCKSVINLKKKALSFHRAKLVDGVDDLRKNEVVGKKHWEMHENIKSKILWILFKIIYKLCFCLVSLVFEDPNYDSK